MFTHLIIIEPLGLLYGSAGAFLSPENLVGRSGSSFPPSSATVSGLYAAKYSHSGTNKRDEEILVLDLPELRIAGPFWAYQNDYQNFYVPTPFNYLVTLDASKKEKLAIQTGKVTNQLQWDKTQKQWFPDEAGKFAKNTWISINEWQNPQTVSVKPWQEVPHLHPRLEDNQRHVDTSLEKGSLFLENAVQLHPEICLVYLTNTELASGWYRFGGESHLVEVKCQAISETVLDLLNQPVNDYFALITPAVWGSNRFSHREPMIYNGENESKAWDIETLFTERPITFRYRLGGKGQTKRLSRGRYAVPAGTVYVLKQKLASWYKWDENWFPSEGYSFVRWGCGLALPL